MKTRVRLLLYLNNLRENIMHDIKIIFFKSLKKKYGDFAFFFIQLNYAIYIVLFPWVWHKSKSIYD